MGKIFADSGNGKMAASQDIVDLYLYKALVETAPVPIWIKDTDNRIIACSKAACELHGKMTGQMEGKTLDSILPKELDEQLRKEDMEIIRSKKPLENIHRTYAPDGCDRPLIISLKKVPLIDAKGNVTHIVVYGNDITEQQKNKELLRKKETQSKVMLDGIPDLMFMTDKNGIFTDFRASENMLFVKPELIIGKSISSLLPPDIADQCLFHIKEAYASKKDQLFEYALDINGTLRFFEARLRAVDENVISLIRDITDWKNAEDETLKSEASYKVVRNKILHDISDALVASLPLNDFYTLVHASLSQIIPADNLCIAIYNKEDNNFACSFCTRADGQSVKKQSMYCAMLEYTMKSMQPVLFNKEEFENIIRKNSLKYTGKIPEWWMGIPMRAGNEYIGIMTLSANSESRKFDTNALETAILISNLVAVAFLKKSTEEKLAQQLDFLNSLMDNFPDLIYVKDKESRFIRFSKSFVKRLKLSNPEELVGKSDFDIFLNEHAQDAFEDEQRIMKTGIPLIGKDEFEIWPSGEKRWANSSKMAWHNSAGEVMGTFGISHDITDRVRSGEELKKNQTMLEAVLNSIPQSVFWKDKDGKFMGCNRIFAVMAGFEYPTQLIGKTDYDLKWPREFVDRYRADDAQVFKSGESKLYNVEIFTQPDGKKLWINTTRVPLIDDAGRVYGILGLSQDITDQKNADMEIQESRRKLGETNQMLKLIINSIPVRLFWKSKDLAFLGCNSQFAEDAGLGSPDELTGKTDFDMPWKDQAEAYRRDDKEVMDTGESKMNYEEIQFNAEGNRVWLLTSKVPLRDMEDKIIGVLGTYDNISPLKEKEAELKSKNEELERFTYTVSHDLKSPLVTIKGFIGLLEEDIESGDAENVHANIIRVKSAADKMSNLLNNLLELSRVGRFANPFVNVRMDKIISDTLDSLSGIIEQKNVQITKPDSMPEVFVDAQRMAEVWQNLIENSIKFMGPRLQPAIEIGYDSTDKFLEFFVRDNGIGIEEKYFSTVFGLFNKLDNKSEGTGFGLALVKRIIEIHGGTIRVESDGKDQGSTFRFTLPKFKRK
jgi:PAS domain S-box-containing protein